jgi:hypothetical protein
MIRVGFLCTTHHLHDPLNGQRLRIKSEAVIDTCRNTTKTMRTTIKLAWCALSYLQQVQHKRPDDFAQGQVELLTTMAGQSFSTMRQILTACLQCIDWHDRGFVGIHGPVPVVLFIARPCFGNRRRCSALAYNNLPVIGQESYSQPHSATRRGKVALQQPNVDPLPSPVASRTSSYFGTSAIITCRTVCSRSIPQA